ncbi:MAG: ABC transporter permease [Herpetosiphonaceae bacterium]|nr:MAG: ABC transporter permease [Herpetosiphonaceae bacterium]
MEEIGRGFVKALGLLISGDPQTWQIIRLSLEVSGFAVFFGTILGLPLGAWLALRRFRGRRLLIALIYTGMGLPPVVVGLVVYLLLSRSGPLGVLNWLFTPPAMILAQTIIALPLIAGLTMAAILGVDQELRPQLRSLGATERQIAWTLLYEARVGVLAGIAAGFGSVISEVGAVMLVGGNIEGSTRVLTTAIVLQTRTGEFELAIALSLVLLLISFLANAAVIQLQGRSLRALL